MIKLRELLNKPLTISGREFKQKYLTTSSKQLEKAYFENGEDIDSMGAVLGDGEYYSVTSDSSDHYESDDYYSGTDYYDLSDNAKILIIQDAGQFSGDEIKKMALANKADGVYDPTEGKNNNPYLGLVIYNSKVVS